MHTNIQVSIFCLAYNHEKFIRESLEGFLMQKTNFDYEILIHEDASTDATAEILKEYQQKYPEMIHVIYESENKYGTGLDYFYDVLLPMAKGKYIAVCEGDDAWVDDQKLQMQFDFMESHPDYTLVGHKAFLQYPADWDLVRDPRCMGYRSDGDVDFESMFLEWNIPTSSFFYRRDVYEKMPRFFMEAPTGDEPLLWYLACKGKVYFMNRVMSVYNKMGSDSWTSRIISSGFERMVQYYKGYIELFTGLDKYTEGEYHDFFCECIKERIRRATIYIMFNSSSYDEAGEMLKILADANPAEWSEYIMSRQKGFWYADADAFQSFCKRIGDRKVYIYGGGGLSSKFILEVLPSNLKVKAVVVSDGQYKKETLEGYPIIYLSEIPDPKKAFVFLTVNENIADQMISNMEFVGIGEYVWLYEGVYTGDVPDNLMHTCK